MRLTSDMKELSSSHLRSTEKQNRKNYTFFSSNIIRIEVDTVKERELINADKQLQLYKKEMSMLRTRLNNKDKVEELEDELKASFNTTITLRKEIKSLSTLQEHQSKELKRISEYHNYEAKILSLDKYLRKLKVKLKELKGEIEKVKDRNSELKEYISSLRPKYEELVSRRHPSVIPRRVRVEIFRDPKEVHSQLVFLQATLDRQRIDNKTEMNQLLLEIYELRKIIRETSEQTSVNRVRIRDMTSVLNYPPPITRPDLLIPNVSRRIRREAFSTMRQRPLNSLPPNNVIVN